MLALFLLGDTLAALLTTESPRSLLRRHCGRSKEGSDSGERHTLFPQTQSVRECLLPQRPCAYSTLKVILGEWDSNVLVLRLGIFKRIEMLLFTLPGIHCDCSKTLLYLSPGST